MDGGALDSNGRTQANYQSACSAINDHDDLNAKDDDMTFCMSNYAKEALKMMFMMRSHNMLTDVILEVKQELFPAHKVVLSAASPYFKAMFTGGLKETEMSRVQLQGVSIEQCVGVAINEYRMYFQQCLPANIHKVFPFLHRYVPLLWVV